MARGNPESFASEAHTEDHLKPPSAVWGRAQSLGQDSPATKGPVGKFGAKGFRLGWWGLDPLPKVFAPID